MYQDATNSATGTGTGEGFCGVKFLLNCCSLQAASGVYVWCRRRRRNRRSLAGQTISHQLSLHAQPFTRHRQLVPCQRYLMTRKSRKLFALLTALTVASHLHRQPSALRQNRKRNRSVARSVFPALVFRADWCSIDFISSTDYMWHFFVFQGFIYLYEDNTKHKNAANSHLTHVKQRRLCLRYFDIIWSVSSLL